MDVPCEDFLELERLIFLKENGFEADDFIVELEVEGADLFNIVFVGSTCFWTGCSIGEKTSNDVRREIVDDSANGSTDETCSTRTVSSSC